MEKPTHTPEPWNLVFNPALDVFVRDKNGLILAKMRALDGIDHQANAARIVECVNAMKGIEDPKAHLSNIEYQKEKAKQERNVAEERYEDLRALVNSLIQLVDEGPIIGPKSIIVQALRKTIQ